MGNDNNDFAGDFNPQPIQSEDNNSSLCQKCKVNPDIIYLSCVHPICQKCFTKSAEENFYDMKCLICQKVIDDPVKKMILGEAKMTELGGNPKTVICQPCVNTFQISDKSDFILLGCKLD